MRGSPSLPCSIYRDFPEPATAQFVSLPDAGEPVLNRLYLRPGRTPEPGRAEEVVVNESFAKAHGFGLAPRFSAILNGRKRELTIVGTALSPEFIYTVGPRRHHAGRPPLRHHLDVGKGACQRLRSRRRVLVRLPSSCCAVRRSARSSPGSMPCSTATAGQRRLRAQGPDLARLARSRARHAQQHEPHAAADFPVGVGFLVNLTLSRLGGAGARADRAFESAWLSQRQHRAALPEIRRRSSL